MSTTAKTPEGTNPCISLYGIDPQGRRCKGCVHLITPPLGWYAKTYFKCDKRKITSGSATDHRVNWPACGRYEAAPAEAE